MLLTEIFEKPVNRAIEGVIKADDEASLFLEVEEYVLTREVEARLGHFLDAYNNYSGANGVWISGFFGSGKSHLLKILSLLLENRTLDGESALDLFLPKVTDNEILRGDLKRTSVIPAKSILFNIDQKAAIISKNQVDALLSVFAKVFDEMCGYFGKQGYIAQFERDLDGRGIYGKFREAYASISGKPWDIGREETLFEGDSIAKAYAQISGSSEDSAKGILDKYRKDYTLSIEDFANQINTYIEQQEPNFRLNFFVDEVGQYIADNTKLMTNLQTIAESLATKCRGRAWVIVTAQEDMNSVVGEMDKQQGNDFSKIQARFANKMKLTSADVAEVIQKRLLLKNDKGVAQLSDVYHEQLNNFKTLFDFADGSQSYRNFTGREHFIHSYPFIPYQFTLFQTAIQNLSQHNAFEGRHASVGERSMLGVFQQVAVHIADHEIRELATFDLMFEGIRTALKAQIQSSVLVAEKHLDDAFAVRLLKALFLVKYVKSFKASIRNLSILMMDNFDRNVTDLQKQVTASLDLLEQQSYIQRNGDLYEYLTDEEKDIEQEIKNTDIENSEITKTLETILFDRIVKQRKIRYDGSGQDYSFSRKLDGSLCGKDYELSINIITPLNELQENETTLSMQSMGKAELLVIMPVDLRFHKDLVLYKRTDSYIRINMTQTQQKTVIRILSDKQQQNGERLSDLEAKAKVLLGQAKMIIDLKALEIGTTDAQSRINEGFHDLIRRTYPSLAMLRGVKYAETDIVTCLKASGATLFGSDDPKMMSEAEQEILANIQDNKRSGVRSTLKKLIERFEKRPYGWHLPAILCNVAKLCAREKIEIREDSNILEDNFLEKALRNTQAQGNLIINPQIDFTASQVRKLKDFYGSFFDSPPKASEAKELARDTQSALREKLQSLEIIAGQKGRYPFLAVLDDPIQQLREISKKEYGYYLTDFAAISEDFLDCKEDLLDPVIKFMNGPAKAIYDESKRFIEQQSANFTDLDGEESNQALAILADQKCYTGNRMQQLKTLVDSLTKGVRALLDSTREAAMTEIDARRQELMGMADYGVLSEAKKNELLAQFAKVETEVGQYNVAAVIREKIRSFKDEAFLQLLNKQSRWAAELKPNKPKAPEKKTQDTGSRDEGKGSGNYHKPKKPETVSTNEPEYISKNSIEIKYQKSILSNKTDVKEYLEAMETAYLAKIEEGKLVKI